MARQIHRQVDIIGLDARWRVKPARELLPTRQGLLLHVVIVVLAKVIGRQRRGTIVRMKGAGALAGVGGRRLSKVRLPRAVCEGVAVAVGHDGEGRWALLAAATAA